MKIARCFRVHYQQKEKRSLLSIISASQTELHARPFISASRRRGH